jgi:hypothetical protein
MIDEKVLANSLHRIICLANYHNKYNNSLYDNSSNLQLTARDNSCRHNDHSNGWLCYYGYLTIILLFQKEKRYNISIKIQHY